ncbi:MAG: hypothetical protein GYB68_16945 [Chloroflexi bacterium]|nr:hypothetical protein [Chloroflexota bacterium]
MTDTTATKNTGPAPAELAVLAVLLGLVLMAVVVIGGALLLNSRQPPAGEAAVAPTPTIPTFEVPTAREAYVPALEVAREFDISAELASGAGAWTAGATEDDLLSGRTGWTFHFYLPATQELVTIVVDRGLRTRVVDQEPWPTAPNLLDDRFWQIDSPVITQRLSENCTDVLAQAADENVEIRLSTAATNGRLLWAGQVTQGETTLCTINVDATTGQVR